MAVDLNQIVFYITSLVLTFSAAYIIARSSSPPPHSRENRGDSSGHATGMEQKPVLPRSPLPGHALYGEAINITVKIPRVLELPLHKLPKLLELAEQEGSNLKELEELAKPPHSHVPPATQRLGHVPDVTPQPIRQDNASPLAAQQLGHHPGQGQRPIRQGHATSATPRPGPVAPHSISFAEHGDKPWLDIITRLTGLRFSGDGELVYCPEHGWVPYIVSSDGRILCGQGHHVLFDPNVPRPPSPARLLKLKKELEKLRQEISELRDTAQMIQPKPRRRDEESGEEEAEEELDEEEELEEVEGDEE